jgi:hypothetical protein
MSRLKTSLDWRPVEAGGTSCSLKNHAVETEKHIVVEEPAEAGELVEADGPVEAEETVKAANI